MSIFTVLAGLTLLLFVVCMATCLVGINAHLPSNSGPAYEIWRTTFAAFIVVGILTCVAAFLDV